MSPKRGIYSTKYPLLSKKSNLYKNQQKRLFDCTGHILPNIILLKSVFPNDSIKYFLFKNLNCTICVFILC